MKEYKVIITMPFFASDEESQRDVRGYVNAILDHLQGLYGSDIMDYGEAQIEIKEA